MIFKSQNPKSSILIEGLWTLGKTTLGQSYCSKYNYHFIPEPLHTDTKQSMDISDIDDWYLQEHKKREHFLDEDFPVVFERSVLSTFAFLYALGQPLPSDAYLFSLKEIIRKKSILIVFLKGEESIFSYQKEDLKNYSQEIQSILLDSSARERYEEWYTKILPYKYGITPFVLRAVEQGSRRLVNDMVMDIHLVLEHKRIAQVNVVCFEKDSMGEVRILILKRIQKRGGFWQTITGGIHPGESLMEAAQREVYEEVGLFGDDIEIFMTETKYFFKGDDGYILDEYVFACKIKNISKVHISEEHEKFEWLPVEGARDKIKYDNNKMAIWTVYKKLGSSM